MKSCFDLTRENLKRFWGIGVFYLVFILLLDIFPMLYNRSLNGALSYYQVRQVLENNNFALTVFTVVIPILTVVIMFRYLQTAAGAAVHHAWPLTRKELFLGHMVPGLILIWLPLLARFIIILAFREPVVLTGSTENIYTLSAVGQMLLSSLSTSGLAYAIALFVTMFTGASLFQAAIAFAFMFLVPGIGALMGEYFHQFLFGYVPGSPFVKMLDYMSPLSQVLTGDPVGPWLAVGYLLAAAVVMAGAYMMYRIRPLEKAGDPIVIDFMIPVFKLLAAFVGMSAVGFYIQYLVEGNEALEILGFALGILIALVIAEMIVQKTFWFVRNTKSYLLFTLISLAFVMGVKMDAFGYERLVPAQEEIAYVTAVDDTFYWYEGYAQIENENRKIENESTIALIRDFHHSIIEAQDGLTDYSGSSIRMTLVYTLNDGQEIIRSYTLPERVLAGMPTYERLFEDDIYQLKFNGLDHLETKTLRDFILSPQRPDIGDWTIDSEPLKGALVEALKEDLTQQTLVEYMTPHLTLAKLIIDYPRVMEEQTSTHSLYLDIKTNHQNLIAVLEEAGYLDEMLLKPEEVFYIVVRPRLDNLSQKETVKVEDSLRKQPESTEDALVVDAEDAILLLLENSFLYGDVDSDFRVYDVEIVLHSGVQLSRCLALDDVPALVSDYFR